MMVENLPADAPDIKSPQLASSSASTADPASSLRAAALLTKKSKRRKAATEASSSILPPRHVPLDSFQLDYGQDDSATTSTTAAQPSALLISKVASAQVIKDAQMREEGEISDSETPRPTPTKKQAATNLPSKKSKKNKASASDNKRNLQKQGQVQSSTPGKLDPHPKGKGKAKEILQPSRLVIPSYGPSIQTLAYEVPKYIVDPDHVRPGLSMNQSQYDTAKNLILDLLGWGVPPEYFVGCGLSRHIIFYVFNELNLRLPKNLDVTGLPPYNPPPKTLSSTPPRTRRVTLGSSSIPPISRPGISSASSQSFSGHHGLSAKPSRDGVDSGLPVVPNDSASSSTTSQHSPAELSTSTPTMTNLHDIEQQRRQELLARKAVIASRKAKQAAAAAVASSMPAMSQPELKDAETTFVPTETVDDFLKSIEPSHHPNGKSSTSEQSMAGVKSSSDAMEVDKSIPFMASNVPSWSATSSSVHPLSADTGNDSTTVPPNSASSGDSTVDLPNAGSEFGLDAMESLPRGTKRRAVASDFVDFEPSRATNGHDYADGGPLLRPNALLRRKTGSGFASVSGMRRCVIDLSDSEDDGEAKTAILDYGEGNRPHRLSPEPIRLLASSTPNEGSRYNTPPIRSTTPTTLMEKEQEIARMRELIKQREQLRKKKLAAIGTAFSTPVDSPTAAPASPAPQQEASNTPRDDRAGDGSPAVSLDRVVSEQDISQNSEAATSTIDRDTDDEGLRLGLECIALGEQAFGGDELAARIFSLLRCAFEDIS